MTYYRVLNTSDQFSETATYSQFKFPSGQRLVVDTITRENNTRPGKRRVRTGNPTFQRKQNGGKSCSSEELQAAALQQLPLLSASTEHRSNM